MKTVTIHFNRSILLSFYNSFLTWYNDYFQTFFGVVQKYKLSFTVIDAIMDYNQSKYNRFIRKMKQDEKRQTHQSSASPDPTSNFMPIAFFSQTGTSVLLMFLLIFFS